jgi:hypothetical protein
MCLFASNQIVKYLTGARDDLANASNPATSKLASGMLSHTNSSMLRRACPNVLFSKELQKVAGSA